MEKWVEGEERGGGEEGTSLTGSSSQRKEVSGAGRERKSRPRILRREGVPSPPMSPPANSPFRRRERISMSRSSHRFWVISPKKSQWPFQRRESAGGVKGET